MGDKQCVCVLGCGPAGLLAAHAYAEEGYLVRIFSQEVRKSPIGGAQFLHKAIPGITGPQPDSEISFLKRGSARGYASKVYGPAVDASYTSWNAYQEGSVKAWSLQAAYAQLWDRYAGDIVPLKLNDFVLNRILESKVYRRIVCTLPRSEVCLHQHEFTSQPVWITPVLPAGVNLPANTIIYSGLHEDPWYRLSNVFGYTGAEYAAAQPAKLPMFQVQKPLSTNCDCWDGKVLFMGRFGKWAKGVLVNHAYREAADDAAAM